MSSLQLVWFRSDLRVTDNPALHHASQAGDVAAVYLLFPQQWQRHGDSPNKLWFWMQNLIELRSALKALNIPLIIRTSDTYAKAPKQLLDLMSQLGCTHLWFNREYGINERQRDKRLIQQWDQHNISCHASVDQTLFVPGSVLNRQGDYFKVFTPFKKHLYQQLSLDDLTPLPKPDKQRPLTLPDEVAAAANIDLETLYTPTANSIPTYLKAGEPAAQEALESFIQELSHQYKDLRDQPATQGTSGLSPWLVSGTLSIRQCFYAALLANNNELDSGNQGLVCWMSELIWREFYKHILYGFPRVSKHKAFIEKTEQLPWGKDPSLLTAWQQGETGYPIVDAAMKQLVTTGLMHNRLRMITAMFLSKNLMLDWRLGEAFFMKHLIDGDLAANNGGWQWSASTGTDAAPYFRMFNPVKQSQTFDPEGRFIRHWLPQLKALDNKSIHEPWVLKEKLTYYPTPIVNHSESRAKVLAAFKQLG